MFSNHKIAANSKLDSEVLQNSVKALQVRLPQGEGAYKKAYVLTYIDAQVDFVTSISCLPVCVHVYDFVYNLHISYI